MKVLQFPEECNVIVQCDVLSLAVKYFIECLMKNVDSLFKRHVQRIVFVYCRETSLPHVMPATVSIQIIKSRNFNNFPLQSGDLVLLNNCQCDSFYNVRDALTKCLSRNDLTGFFLFTDFYFEYEEINLTTQFNRHITFSSESQYYIHYSEYDGVILKRIGTADLNLDFEYLI